MLNGLVTAMRTLTILRIPGKDADNLASSLPWFPLAGLVIGTFLYVTADIWNRLTGGSWPEGLAMLLVAESALLTRGLHLDGLADWADGFWGGHDRERVLAIMKDSSIGTFGSIALFCVLLSKWICITKLLILSGEKWFITACIISRNAQVMLAVLFPYARQNGGTAVSFINNSKAQHLIIALSLSIALIFLTGEMNLIMLILLTACFLIVLLFGKWALSRIGGITGDILGAGSELVEVFVLYFAVITLMRA